MNRRGGYRGRGRGNFRNKSHWQNKGNGSKGGNKYRHTDQLTEPEVGITEYLGELEGFAGILKARFSDFHVNEIDPEGNIAKLTSREIPKDFRPEPAVDLEAITESPCDKIPQDVWEKLKSVAKDKDAEDVHMEAEKLEKEERKAIYECVKKHFGTKIWANTITVDGDKKVLAFRRPTKDVDRRTLQWPEDKGEYVHFLMYKESVDTMDACMKVSSCLRIGSHVFNYAGVKDKRAKTTQWMSARKVEPWKLISKTRPLRNIILGNITFKDHPLKLGDLSGNRFKVALRNVTAADEVINAAVEFVKNNGFINYYGLQRFGNDKEAPTYLVGVKLMQGKFDEAVKLILKQKKSDDPEWDVAKAKKIYAETGDAKKAFEAVKSSVCIEAKLLEGLANTSQNEYVNALEKIPRNTRLLYIHALQSLIWNRMVSKRIKEFGLKPVAGDLIVTETNDAETEDPKETEEEDEEDEIKCLQEVRALTEEELDSYSMEDVVLPLPGYDVQYPEHMRDFYREALAEMDMTLEMPRQRVKTYTLSGGYRNVLVSVRDLTWRTRKYKDQHENLILSDFEELKGYKLPQNADEDCRFKALVMEFSLPSSSYATMVLREVLKIDTSTQAHVLMNESHNSEQKEVVEKESEGIIKESTLLSDKSKFEAFKNSVFLADGPVKRPGDEEDKEEEDGQRKKARTNEAEESGIRMEASLV